MEDRIRCARVSDASARPEADGEGAAPAPRSAVSPGPGGPAQPVVSSRASGSGALLVSLGILASRFAGLLREAVFARYFGNTDVSAAFKAALRIPNFLQNLLGEGVLSASFIPVYSQLLGAKQKDDAERVAGAVFSLLTLFTGFLVAVGILATPWLVDVVAPGFEGETRALATSLVRILFPMTGMLVGSAWCLGVLNSHRRFFLSYAAPVIWNGAMIATMLVFGRGANAATLARSVAIAAVAGAGLQFLVQLPTSIALLGRFRPNLRPSAHLSRVLRSFGPVVVARGVVQVSAYVDLIIGSWISAVAFSTLDYAQRVYLIPISIFGMSISAAELPEMSRATGEEDDVAARLRERLRAGLRRVAFFVIPSAVAFVTLGDVIAAALLQRGHFSGFDSRLVWYVLIGSAVGLLATTQSRLLSSTFYALKDTITPLKVSVLRVTLTAAGAYVAGLHLPRWLGLPPDLGAVGLVGATGVAAWLEFVLLRRQLIRRIGNVPLDVRRIAMLWGAGFAAALLGVAIKVALAHVFGANESALQAWGGHFLPLPKGLRPELIGAFVLVPYGLAYLAITYGFRVPEAQAVLGRVLGRLRRRAR